MTKQQMSDSILFALDELGKAKAELAKIPALDITTHPFREPVLSGECVAYNFGRAEGMAKTATMWLEFGIKTLEECVAKELTALAKSSTTKSERRTNQYGGKVNGV